MIKKNITLKDIARKTGYSSNTISRALRDKSDIGLDTRQKIKQLAAELGYVNNTMAISFRSGVTRTLAVILGDVANPHFAIMMREIEIRAREDGYSTFLLNTMEDEALEMKAIQTALHKNVDGIILCPTQKSRQNLDYLKKSTVPFVLIGRHEPDCSYVVCDDEAGGYLATKALIEAGHRSILLLQGPLYISSARERLAGYLRAHQEAGILVDSRLIEEVPTLADGCANALTRLDHQGVHYTAIFAFSDMLAWEAWSYLQRQGRQVPKDCSLIGFDHIQSRLNLPFLLSSVSTFKGQMSSTAVELLLSQMTGKTSPEQVVIRTMLALGQTIAPIESSER